MKINYYYSFTHSKPMNIKPDQTRNFYSSPRTQKKFFFRGAAPVLFFIVSFIAASYYTSFDQHMKQCRKNNNTYNYCESIYRG